MNLCLTSQGFETTEAISAAVRENFRGALDRFEDRIESVDVYLSDDNGPKGGRDKQVVARIRLYSRQVIAVERTRSNLYAAIADVSRLSRRRVRRALKKAQRLERGMLRATSRAATISSGPF